MILKKMRQKRMIWLQGLVLHPVAEGKTVKYCQNGIWKETEEVVRVIYLTNESIKFETARYCYCIEFQKREAELLRAVA